jgi:N-acetylglutamate synthase-like GNAT family acetyltransferase
MTDAEAIAALFQDHRDELGFVNTAQCREKTTYTVQRDGKLVGAALCNHCVQKPQTTLYDIAVREQYRGRGFGQTLVEQMATDSPHQKIIAKCPATLPAVQFYNQCGWTLVAVEDGKKRPLTVWKYDI